MKQNIKLLYWAILILAIIGLFLGLFFRNRFSKVELLGKLERKLSVIKIVGNVFEETSAAPTFPVSGAQIKCGINDSITTKTGLAGEFILQTEEKARPFFLLCEISASGYKSKSERIRIIDRWKVENGEYNIGGIYLEKL